MVSYSTLEREVVVTTVESVQNLWHREAWVEGVIDVKCFETRMDFSERVCEAEHLIRMQRKYPNQILYAAKSRLTISDRLKPLACIFGLAILFR